MNFEEALAVNDFGDLLEKCFGKWGHFTPEAADLCLDIAKLESITPTLICFTMLNESTFDMRPLPNTNKEPLNFWKWDIGPWQLNLGWTFKSVWVLEFSSKGILPNDCFGKVFVDEAGQPSKFTGDPLANGRMAARKLKSLRGLDIDKATLYTGPSAQPNRRKSYEALSPMFDDFFRLYTKGE